MENFTLTVPEESGLTLVFSFVGMKTQEVVLSGQQVLHIVMLEDVSQMEEVIVTGYQEVKKEKMTGAVTTISSEKLSDRYTPNLIQNLEARVAGLSTYGGKPIIRGTGYALWRIGSVARCGRSSGRRLYRRPQSL